MKPIPPGAVGAIHRLAFAVTEDEAAALIEEAIRRGTDVDDALDALNLWRKYRAADMTRLYSSDGMESA